MLTAKNISLQFGKRVLFDGVNIQFVKGNCYGIIGANGAGKSTLLKILAGEQHSTSGEVELAPEARLAFLRQDHFAFDNYTVLDTVIMGHEKLYSIMTEKNALYMKPDFSDADGMKVADLEAQFAEMGGWNAEAEAAKLLSNLGVSEELHTQEMQQISGNQKVRVLLAQALFGQPDVLLLDEPTNDLDAGTIRWLENFLADYQNTVVVVSHDRHFLDAVCTHICDIDFGKVRLFTGNYSFWYESSQLITRQLAQKNKKAEDKVKELKEFIARFSANASKSRQATSRKKALDKLVIEELRPSTRKYPHIAFTPERKAGNQVLEIKNLSYVEEGKLLFENINILLEKDDRIALLSRDSKTLATFYAILAGERKPTTGTVEWGVTIKPSYLPNENQRYFNTKENLIDWLRQFSENKEEPFIRGFLGRMLFSGEETLKSAEVLSGGEKVRCMLSRLMLQHGNFLLLNEPTNHLDLESITALNNAMNAYEGNFMMSSHDHALLQTTCNRIIEIGPNGMIDKAGTTYDDYLNLENLAELRAEIYEGSEVEA